MNKTGKSGLFYFYAERRENMNFVEFNKLGTIIKSNINNIYATSNNYDNILIFAEFDTSATSNIEVSVTFKRSDGVVVGPILAEPHIHEDRFCRKVTLDKGILCCSGPLQITVRYQEFDMLDGEIVAVKTRAVGMLTCNVYDAVEYDHIIPTDIYSNLVSLVADKVNKDLRVYEKTVDLENDDLLLIYDQGTEKTYSVTLATLAEFIKYNF